MKTFVTTIIVATLCIAEWKMWHFFRYEFKAYNPSDKMVAATFIGWMFLAVILAVMTCVLLANIYKPKEEGDTNGQG